MVDRRGGREKRDSPAEQLRVEQDRLTRGELVSVADLGRKETGLNEKPAWQPRNWPVPKSFTGPGSGRQ